MAAQRLAAQLLGRLRQLITILAGILNRKLTIFRRTMAKSAEAACWAF
jgi:hypothetical protein